MQGSPKLEKNLVRAFNNEVAVILHSGIASRNQVAAITIVYKYSFLLFIWPMKLELMERCWWDNLIWFAIKLTNMAASSMPYYVGLESRPEKMFQDHLMFIYKSYKMLFCLTVTDQFF